MKSEIKYLLSIESKGIKLGLERTQKLSNDCGNPHEKLKAIQVAGTNGKGSTCAIIANILRVSGYKVGLFTSPHLINVNERIRINGNPISDDEIAEYIQLYQKQIEKNDASFFETVTIMAFWYFNKMNVDYAIMETGLGGRLDSVTICNPIMTIITSISLDHTEILGDTLEKIAKEKTGIIKQRIPCVTIEHSNQSVQNIIKETCEIKNAQLIISKKTEPLSFNIGLNGKFQNENARLAQTAINHLNLNLNLKFIKSGLANIRWHGRNQIIYKQPLVIFDVAHNASGIDSFINFYKTIAVGKKILVISLQKRKNILTQVKTIESVFDQIIICETKNKRTMTTDELKQQFIEQKKIIQIQSASKAIQYALDNTKPTDSIGIIGTHFLGEPVSKIFNISFNLL